MPTPPDAPDLPDRIGPYRLLEPLGEGGMGRVWLAEQSQPVRRRVALKLIKLGMDTKEVVARFESERQALAVMDHPSIAKVFDGGTTEEGRPYFVMEAVSGIPITEYCDKHRLSTADRIRLFGQVCGAVQHAHHKGVIHRDLKPSNVLVTVTETGPVAKVIDFGVAKAVGGRLTDKTLVTSIGQMVGTRAYMSPEQAERSGLDVDTRTDVYALGVMLYELLVGVLPFDLGMLRQPALVLQHLLREKDAPTPSVRLSSLDDTQETMARLRRTDVRTLRRELRGDLDWIVMKAMDKDRTRRYETANGLASDLERFLSHEPVVARPPSAPYRVVRFVRRNRVGVGAATVTAAALLAGIVGTSTGLVRARAAESDARAAQATAQEEARTAQEVSRFLAGLFQGSNPNRTTTGSMTAREILDRGAERIRTELEDQPVVRARLMRTIGTVYQSLALYDPAVALHEESLAVFEEELGPEHEEVATTLMELSRAYPGESHDERKEPMLRRALGTYEKTTGPESVGAARAVNSLAVLMRSLGRLDEAEPLYRRAIAILDGLPDQQTRIPEIDDQLPRTVAGRTRMNLSGVYQAMGRTDAADSVLSEALAAFEETLPADHPVMGNALGAVAGLRVSQGRHEEAYAANERELAIMEQALGEWHLETARALQSMGYSATTLGRFDAAETHYRRAVAILDSLFGSESGVTARARVGLGRVALARDEPARAEAFFHRALGPFEATLGTANAQVRRLIRDMVAAMEAQGRLVEAADVTADWLARLQNADSVRYSSASRAVRTLNLMLTSLGDATDMEARHSRLVERIEQSRGEGPVLVAALHALARFYQQAGRLDEREDALVRTVGVLERAGAGDEVLAESLITLARNALSAGRPRDALSPAAHAATLRERSRGSDPRPLVDALYVAGVAYDSHALTADLRDAHGRALELLSEHLDGEADTTWTDFAYLGAFSRSLGERRRSAMMERGVLRVLDPAEQIYTAASMRARVGLASDLVVLGEMAEAVTLLEEAIADYDRPRDPAATRAEAGHLVNALELYQEALSELGRHEEAQAAKARVEEVRRSLGIG